MANQLQVYREGDLISTFNIDEGTVFVDKLQGERTITCPAASKDALQLEEGDYIIHENEVYLINNLPDFEKDGGKLQKSYNIVFEAEFYLLLDTFVINGVGQKQFPLYGTAEDHLQLIFNNANRNDTGWTVGEVEATGGELINYDWTYVRTALNEIADRFKLEWSFTGRTLRMVSTIGTDTNLTFEVGRGKGLHQIKRTKDTSKSVLTRVFGVGGSRNIDHTYRDGVERNLIFEGGYVETPGVTAGTERVREGKYTNEEIYPRFNGVVGSVVVHKDGAGLITDVVITDAAIDFDINTHLQEGEKALVHFRTGALTGTDFEINSYNHATKAIELIPVADTNGYVLPNDLNLPEVGNQFTLLNLRMPVEYIASAELELRNETLQFLEDNRKARLLFGVKPDQRHLRANNIRLKVGDRGTVIEADAQVNEILRFTEISYPLVNKFDVTAVIGSEIRYDRVVKLFADTIQTRKDVQTIDRRSAELAKRGVQNLRALESSIFDTDGKFDSDKINVGVLSAILGIFGAKSQNFKLNGVYITDNYNGDNSKVYISSGELIHFEISNPGNANIWTMTSRLADSLSPTALYYVYAKCSRLSQVGSWVVTTEQIKPEDEPDFYHFLTGVVYPVIDSWRNSDFTNGIADINGNRLKIGKIVSRDGLTGFDLDNSEIFGRIVFRAAGGGLKNVTDVDAAALNAISLATTAQGVADAANNTANSAQSAANAAQTSANNALIAASDAQEDADAANVQLADIANDNLLTVSEKPDVLKEWLIIQGEKPIIEAQAGQYSVDTTDYTAAFYYSLNNYLPGLLADMNSNSPIVGADFRLAFKTYYDAKVALLKSISDAAKVLADNAQTSANNVQSNLNALSAGLGGLAYADVIQLAMLGETIVEGGYIKADLIEITTLIVRGGLETSTGAQSKADAAQAAAAADASDKVNAIEVGGRNLLLQSGEPVTNNEYRINIYNLSEPIAEGKICTITIWGELGSDRTYWGIYNSGGSVSPIYISRSDEVSPGVFQKTFPWLVLGTANNSIHIYMIEYTAVSTSTITKIKLEKGNKATDWSPAPEDVTEHAIQAALDSETAAKNFATAQDNAKLVEAIAYADGVVSAEEAARIIDANAKLAEAKADATAKAYQAELNASNLANKALKTIYDGIFENGRDFWATTPTGSINLDGEIISGIALTGSNVWRFTNHQWIYSKNAIPIDHARTYELTLKIRVVQASTIPTGFYCGFAQLYADGSAPPNSGNNYVVITGQDLAVEGWKTYKARFNGGNFYDTNITSICPLVGVNYTTGDAIVEIDSLTLEDVTAAVLVENNATQTIADSEAATKAYADAKDNLKAIEAAAYADDIVDAEEARAIADAENKLAIALADSTAKSEAARIAAEQAAALDASNKVNSITGGNVNLLMNTARFANNDHWQNTQVAGQYDDGTPCLRSTNIGSGTLYQPMFRLKANTIYTFSCMYYRVGTEVPDPRYPMHIEFEGIGSIYGTQYWRGSVYETEKDLFRKVSVTFSTPDSDVLSALYIHDPTATAQPYFTYIKLEEGRIATTWTEYTPSVGDIDVIAQTKANAALASANATAESIATSKANIAEANAISAAAGDATGKANAARLAAEAASATYADTVANSAASAAQIAAAADASNKAQQARVDAENAAAAAQAALTAQLKNMAYTEIDQLEGITTITKNGVTTVKLDADYIKANVVNADYIEALEIVAKTLAAISGTIGPLNITPHKLWLGSENTWESGVGVININSEYQIFRKNGYISGQVREVAFNLNSALGGENYTAYKIENSIENKSPSPTYWKNTNYGVIIDAANADINKAIRVKNGDVEIENGDLIVGGMSKFTGDVTMIGKSIISQMHAGYKFIDLRSSSNDYTITSVDYYLIVNQSTSGTFGKKILLDYIDMYDGKVVKILNDTTNDIIVNRASGASTVNIREAGVNLTTYTIKPGKCIEFLFNVNNRYYYITDKIT